MILEMQVIPGAELFEIRKIERKLSSELLHALRAAA